jgi:tripartite-type tricarboxylate transporter receptor subunit TctC
MTASELRRSLRHTAWTIAVIVGMTVSSAFAQSYPARTVTIITPFAAGSQTDAAARLVGLYLQDALGGSFIVENKAGAGGLIAANTVARAKPDGYTLLLTTNSTHSAIAGTGVQVFWQGPQELADFVKAELVKYNAMIKEAGIEPE